MIIQTMSRISLNSRQFHDPCAHAFSNSQIFFLLKNFICVEKDEPDKAGPDGNWLESWISTTPTGEIEVFPPTVVGRGRRFIFHQPIKTCDSLILVLLIARHLQHRE